MDELNIELKNGAETVKALYYTNGQGNIFTYKRTRWLILRTAGLLLLSIILYFVAINIPVITWIFISIISSAVALASTVNLALNTRKYLNWKKQVKEFLKVLAKYESQWLTLTYSSIEIVNNDKTTIDKWENVKHISVFSDHISIRMDDQALYVFPAKSMEPEQFNKLKEFVKNRMKL
ncbi:MAG TPA: YcxB family protein [Nitrosopumilaceae archaeon]|jgi:hypothetical protein|nr:YcxB family protein [Nitrosopumilaceae archaeon]